jgi:putative NADH-flavin reductase
LLIGRCHSAKKLWELLAAEGMNGKEIVGVIGSRGHERVLIARAQVHGGDPRVK